MKGNITEEKLMAYLYGEITPEERREVEQYLMENPEKQQEIEALGNVRSIMGHWEDEEDMKEPAIQNHVPSHRQGPFDPWKLIAVAASLALLITIGWLSSKNSFVTDPEPHISLEKVEQLISHQEKLTDQNEKLLNRIAELEMQVGTLASEQLDYKDKLLAMQDPNVRLAKNMVDGYFAEMQAQNKVWLDENFKTMNEQQQQYVHTLIADFGVYIAQQQKQEIDILHARMQYLEQNTGEFQLAAAQLIAGINNSQLQQENY